MIPVYFANSAAMQMENVAGDDAVTFAAIDRHWLVREKKRMDLKTASETDLRKSPREELIGACV